MTVAPAAVNAGSVTHPAVTSLLPRVLHEAMTIPRGWVTRYGPYQSGGWQTLSVINATGDPADVTIADNTCPVPTSLLGQMPATAALVGQLGLDIWWARLALMQPSSYLWEHRDYTETGIQNTERYRIHLPLVTSGAAYLVSAGHALHMSPGRLWRINPTTAHGAANLAGPPRLHLLLDCHDSDGLAAMRAAETLPGSSLRSLPRAGGEELDEAARTAAQLARLGWAAEAERSLLHLYFTRALGREGQVYDMISAMYDGLGDSAAADAWQDRKSLTLGSDQ